MNEKQNEIKIRSDGTIKYFIDAYKAQINSIKKQERIIEEIDKQLSKFKTVAA